MDVSDTIFRFVYMLVFTFLSVFTAVVSWLNGRSTKSLCKSKPPKEEGSIINVLVDIIPQAIKDAESWLGAKTGPAKKSLVVERIQNACYRLGIEYNEELFDKAIESYFNTKKTVTEHKEEVKDNVYPRR